MVKLAESNSLAITFDCLCLLQNQLEEVRQKMGAQLSERYVSQQKGTQKMMASYDSLRRDLMKVRGTATHIPSSTVHNASKFSNYKQRLLPACWH